MGRARICEAAPPPMLTDVGDNGEEDDSSFLEVDVDAMLFMNEAWKPVVPEVISDEDLPEEG